ncbi:thiopurine S-methyltransferase [Microbulbifer yueqingensis]|uniref:Thiopurine S-methyltransferase n=1 Tax=Microbulbifer yueqingensis TaxID=658219 RepID=A0A1G8VA43_9GAMM|nr:thiopurine S-methyltransferase [Microbulbifer yueqingensis]SDJ62829.1 thiopurine S-methyltransferase [Microbulbifer yueqingensis]
MDAEFWHRKWQDRDIGFHAPEANPLLVGHFSRIAARRGARVFVPLCGKTLDIHWLLAQGYRVVGAELNRQATVELFSELGVEPEIAPAGGLEHFSAEGIDIFVGDIFDVSRRLVGEVDAIYDRAALVALPPEMRERYTAHLVEISNGAPQLLITFEYDQALMPGPPFAVSGEEMAQHYGGNYSLELADSQPVPGGLKGRCAATENAWILQGK